MFLFGTYKVATLNFFGPLSECATFATINCNRIALESSAPNAQSSNKNGVGDGTSKRFAVKSMVGTW